MSQAHQVVPFPSSAVTSSFFADPIFTPSPELAAAATTDVLCRMSAMFDALCKVNPKLAGISFRREDGGGTIFYSFGGCEQ